MRYEPDEGPDPRAWLALGEAERVTAIRQQHERVRERSGNPQLHAAIHCVVETQLAEGHAAARETMARLLREGLDRHEAIHAVGSVVAGEMFEILKSQRPHDAEAYGRKLAELTAGAWRNELKGNRRAGRAGQQRDGADKVRAGRESRPLQLISVLDEPEEA